MDRTWPFPPPAASLGPNVSSEKNPRVFLDVSIDGGPAERMVIELFANIVPITAENFRALCTGEKGNSKTTGRALHYKGTVFHRIRKGLVAEGGDISKEQDGSGGESIYGGYFKDENFQLCHSEPGLLSMANRGPNTNGSQFYLTFVPLGLIDGFHVVFGKVIEGMSTLDHIDKLGTPGGDPSGVVKITDCGQIYEDKDKKKKSLNTSDELVKEHCDEIEKQRNSSSEGWLQISEDKKNNVMEFVQGKKKKSLKRASSSDELVKEHSDGREKRSKPSSSEGLLQISDYCGKISEDIKNNLMESDQGEHKFFLNTSDERVKEDSDEREKHGKDSPSAGLLQISEDEKNSVTESDQGKKNFFLNTSDERVKERGDEREKQMSSSSEALQISKEKKNSVMKSDQERGFLREQVGDDSRIMEMRQQIAWLMASVREIANNAGDVHLPDYPLPCLQQQQD